MARVLIFRYGESVYFDRETSNIELQNPMTDIVVEHIPTNHTFSAACIISDFDFFKKNEVRYELRSKQRMILNSNTINLEPWEPSETMSSCMGVQIGMDFRNISIDSQEPLATYLYFNNTLIGEYPINVICKAGD